MTKEHEQIDRLAENITNVLRLTYVQAMDLKTVLRNSFVRVEAERTITDELVKKASFDVHAMLTDDAARLIGSAITGSSQMHMLKKERVFPYATKFTYETLVLKVWA